jgi:hypothetical protein
MHKKQVKILFPIIGILSVLVFFRCGSNSPKEESKTTAPAYLNLSDSVKYVGINTCKLCHQDIYNSFIQTGMGKSFDVASKAKSSARFDKHSVIYDKYEDFYYFPFWDKDSLKIKEYRLEGKDTVYKRIEKVDYIIGSGQHTNSHIFNTNGYLHQMPMTYYTQKGQWDLPPGFENGFNSRFSRKIGLECMSCHNAYPDMIMGSENKYNDIPNGINCERCHGPGSVHVQQKTSGKLVYINEEIDYSIVNPAKLPIDLQFDVCQRCHLQGNAVLKEGRSFYDFKPGMKLSDVFTVFLPKYENAEKDFIMASHADRLKMSQCFIKSFKPEESKNSLKPYKDALTCVTCHNPHVSVKFTGKEIFNNACKNCHGVKTKVLCSEEQEVRNKVQDNCISCHMPTSGAIDIPHVTVTDHFIRKPVEKGEIEKVKRFIGLYAVNEKDPDKLIKAKAYINQYEKFNSDPALLDSAEKYLDDKTKDKVSENFSALIHFNFLKQNYAKMISYVNVLGKKEILSKKLKTRSWSNDDAWTCYRIAEAFQNTGKISDAFDFYTRANVLTLLNMDFQNKLGSAFFQLGRINESANVYERIISEDAKYAPAYCNLGYIYFTKKEYAKAEHLYDQALNLDPDYDQALMNKSQLLLSQNKFKEAKDILKRMIKKNPSNEKARQILEQLKNS